jgi:hypothetical protein
MKPEPHCNTPFLFIAGVSKAGTTSLFRYLGEHPEVRPCKVKEPFYFVPKECFFNPALRYGENPLRDYLALFPQGGKHHPCLDGSTLYFMFPDIAEVIDRVIPSSKVIISLREPVARLKSCYQMALFHSWIPAGTSFDDYVGYMLDGRQDVAYRSLFEEGRYSTRLREWRRVFGEERLLTLWFDDIAKRPDKVMATVAQFAGIDSSFYDDYSFGKENAARVLPNSKPRQVYQAFKHQVRELFPKSVFIRRALSTLKWSVEPWLRERMAVPAPLVTASVQTLETLQTYYAADVEPLTRLLGQPPPWAEQYAKRPDRP